jgi:O-antigen/teichoic acid export membrane protein
LIFTIKPTYIGNLGITLITNILLAILALVGGILTARMLGPTGRGELAAIQTFPTILASLAMVGVPDALVYFSARQSESVGSMLSTSILIALTFCFPFAIAGYFLIPILLSSQSTEIVHGSRNYLWLLPVYATTGMLVHPLRGRNEIPSWNLVRIFPSALWLIVVGVLFIVGINNPVYLTNLYLIGMACLFFPTGILVLTRIKGSYKPASNYIHPFLAYGIPTAFSTIPYLLNSRLDQILLAAFFEPKLLGYYVVAISWSNTITPLTSVLPSVMLPHIASIQGQDQQIRTLTQNTRMGVIISMTLALLAALFSPLFIPFLFGSEFVSVIPISIVLSIAAGFLALKQVLEAGLLSLGKPKIVLAAESLGLMITATLLFILLKPYELVGASLTALVSYLAVTIFLVLAIHKIAIIPISEIIVPKRLEIYRLWERLKKGFISLFQMLTANTFT